MQNWPAKLKGGCLCGDIRYEVTGPAIFVAQCCCRDCQKATGTVAGSTLDESTPVASAARLVRVENSIALA